MKNLIIIASLFISCGELNETREVTDNRNKNECDQCDNNDYKHDTGSDCERRKYTPKRGKDGYDGRDGGKEGRQGPQGEVGPVGPQGPAGKDGTNGLDGTNGKDGIDGKDGKDYGILTVIPLSTKGLCVDLGGGYWAENEGSHADIYLNSDCNHYSVNGVVCNNMKSYGLTGSTNSGEICWVNNTIQFSIEGKHDSIVIYKLEFNL